MRLLTPFWSLSAISLATSGALESVYSQDSDLIVREPPTTTAYSALIIHPSEAPADLKDVRAEDNKCKKLSCTYDGCVCISSASTVEATGIAIAPKDFHASMDQSCEKESCTYDGCVCVSAAVATPSVMGFLSPILDFLTPVLSLKSLLFPAVGLLSALLFYY